MLTPPQPSDPGTLLTPIPWTWRRLLLFGASLVLVAVCAHALTLASPGFYSHDEWQKFDLVKSIGFWHFAADYGTPQVGPDFGFPMRPIGFLQQGVASLWMQSHPWLAHLVGVLNQALAALVFCCVLRQAGFSLAVVTLAPTLFVLSPLTTLATGWLAASFDQLYVVFLLTVAAVLVTLRERGITMPGAAVILFGTTAALLSKETAIVAPGVVLLIGFVDWSRHRRSYSWRLYGVAFALVLAPVAAYLWYRAPAIAGSLHGHGLPVYTPSLANVPDNVIRYFAFPFLVDVDGMGAMVWVSPARVVGALAIHAILVATLCLRFGGWVIAAYLGGYFLFLIPVLPLPTVSDHYLYASGLITALALALALEHAFMRRYRLLSALLIACAVMLGVQTYSIESMIYATGVCQSRFLDSLDALVNRGGPGIGTIQVTSDPGAPEHIAMRSVFARIRYEKEGTAMVHFGTTPTTEGLANANPARTRVHLTQECKLRVD
ncbi:MAG: hypothetical protein ABI607_09705 [Betaproteobacteria bacterium]